MSAGTRHAGLAARLTVTAMVALAPGVATARQEMAVTFRAGLGPELHGTLMLPELASSGVPLVVIVPEVADPHRSAILLDAITDRLVADGCAVARYVIPAARERVPAAIAAARTLRSRHGIDDRRVFLLGRGTATHEILAAAAHNPDLAGVALLDLDLEVAPAPGGEGSVCGGAPQQAQVAAQWQRRTVRKQLQQTRCPVLLMAPHRDEPGGDRLPSEQAAALAESGNPAATVRVMPNVDEYFAAPAGVTDARTLAEISSWVRATPPASRPWWSR